MARSVFRVVFPLAALTATGLLATDLYLPALPLLPAQLGGSISAAQATLASFMAALALSQLLWGAAVDRYGCRAVLSVALGLQILAGIACALAPSVNTLIAVRAVQGLGVGAATVVVPALVRQKFSGADVVQAMSWLGIAESLIPAIGPIAGALLLTLTGWRTSFWIVAGITAVLAPFALRLVPGAAAAGAPVVARGYRLLLANRRYVGYALGHALCFAALLAFVASAPQVVNVWLQAPPLTFALLQACGVGAFIAVASQSGRLTTLFGIDRLILLGVVLQIVAALGFMGLALGGHQSAVLLTATWALFCAALGLRGPATMAQALAVQPELVGRAAELMMFLALGLAAAGTQLVAPFLTGGLLPVAWMCVAFTMASALVMAWGFSGGAATRQRS
jgi:predicted MFS family arabinose efflux permease